MLPKINRLTKNKEFDHVFKRGRSKYSDIIGLKIAPNQMTIARFGIIIGNKVSKKAVARNRIKRQLREIFKSNLEHLSVGQDYVIVVLPKIIHSDFAEIKKTLEDLLRKMRVLK